MYFTATVPLLITRIQVSVLTEPSGKELGYVDIPLVGVLYAPGRLLQREYLLQGTYVCFYEY